MREQNLFRVGVVDADGRGRLLRRDIALFDGIDADSGGEIAAVGRQRDEWLLNSDLTESVVDVRIVLARRGR